MASSPILLFVLSVAVALTWACSTPPTLPPGSTWVPSVGCNGTLHTATSRCHCWGHCGYICNSKSTTTTRAPKRTTVAGPTGPPTTCNSKYANGPTTLPDKATWLSLPGCSFGDSPKLVLSGTTAGRCRCYALCGYICEQNL